MTTTPDENAAENAAIATRLAVVEVQLAAVQEGQRQIIARLDAMQQSNDATHQATNARLDSMEQANSTRFDALNGRIDRLFYTILALGIAAIGTLIALDKVL